MKNTGIEYISSEKTPEINPAFSDLLPPLPDEQYAQLEVDILTNGCYAPVILNEDMEIVDGHHRYEICNEHDLPFKMMVFSFEDVLEAQQWALDTQKARRNLSTWELGQIALKLKPEVEARANERQGMRSDIMTTLSESSEKGTTRKELADAVGVGEVTMGKIMKIDEHAPESVKEAMDDGMSVNKGYEITKQVKDLPEDERDEAAKTAILLDKAKKDERHRNKVVDDRTKVAKQYCTAFEKAILIVANEQNVRTWIEWAGVRKDEIAEMLHQSKEISASFSTIAGILEIIYEKEVVPYEDEELAQAFDPNGDTEGSQAEDSDEAEEEQTDQYGGY